MKIKLSQSDWESIGKKMGWIKTAWDDEPDRRVIGYWYHGKQHTPAETRRDLKNGVLKATNPKAYEDDNGIPESGVEDSEGNIIDTVLEPRRSNPHDPHDFHGEQADREINQEREMRGDYGHGY